MSKVIIFFLIFCVWSGVAHAEKSVIVPSGTITIMDDDMEVVELVLEKGTKGHWYFHADGRKYRVADATSEELFDVALKKEKKEGFSTPDFIYTDESEWRKKTMFFFFRRDDHQWRHRRSDTPVSHPQQQQNPLGILLEGILKGNR